MVQEKGLMRKEDKFQLLEGDNLRGALTKVRQFQAIVKKMLIPNIDYGVIPGTGDKPTLLKPGAEKLSKMHGLADKYEILERVEDFEKPFFNYVIKCTMFHIASGEVISEGFGSCNSMESKFRYRWVNENKVPPELNKEDLPTRSYNNKFLYRIDNDDICSQANTILKMGKKRAQVDATLSACRLSAVFTQDFDDIEDATVVHHPAPGKKPDVQEPQSKSQQQPNGNGEKKTGKEEIMLSVQEALDVKVGTTFSMTGMITDMKERTAKTKKGPKVITDYSVANDESTIIVSLWGAKEDRPEIHLDCMVAVKDVLVGEWQGDKKYTAKDINPIVKEGTDDIPF